MHELQQRRRWWVVRTVGADIAVIVLGVAIYFGIRGQTAGNADVAVRNAHDVLAVEKELGLDVEAGVQALLVDVDIITTLANWVYIWGHWPVIALTLGWLALHDRTLFLRLRNAMIASGLMGLCVYTTYPVAPPRLAGLGFVDTITEQSRSYRVLQPPAFVNQYAAMPSLHVGWDLVVGLALVAAASSVAVRTVGRLMPVVMGAATVVTANHYVLDVLIGAAFGLAGWAVALRLERRREARAARSAAAPAVPGAVPPVPDPRQPDPRPPWLPARTVQDSAGQGRAGLEGAGQDRAGQDRAGPDRAGPDQAGQDRAGQDRAGQDRAGQDRAALDLPAQRSSSCDRRTS